LDDDEIMFNTLRAMYHHHPIKVDIAGSVESIYSITKDDLQIRLGSTSPTTNNTILDG
jgi:hypothetical protein